MVKFGEINVYGVLLNIIALYQHLLVFQIRMKIYVICLLWE